MLRRFARLAPVLPLFAPSAFGQTPLANPEPNADPGVLRGPSVKESQAPATLIERDMSGHLVRLDTRPEQAAVALLNLTADQRRPIDELFAERFTNVNALLSDHTDLFLKIQAARQGGGDLKDIAPLMREFRDAAGPLLETPLADQVAARLPEDKRTDFARIVDEYKRALIAEGPPGGQPAPADGTARAAASPRAAQRTEANLLLREMGRALKSLVDERRQRFDELIKTVDATPEQEARLQAIVREKPASGLRPTAEDREARERKIMDVLTPEQRRKLLAARREMMDTPK